MSHRFLLLLPWTALVALALLVAVVGHRYRTGEWRFRAALTRSGTAAIGTALLLGILRLIDWLGATPGPLEWIGQTASAGSDPLALAHAACRLGLGAGAAFGGTLIIGAWWSTRSPLPSPAARLPSSVTWLIAGVAALAGLVTMMMLAMDPVALEPLIDLAAIAPVVAWGLALSGLAAAYPPGNSAGRQSTALAEPADGQAAALTVRVADPGRAATMRGPDPESVLRRSGMLSAGEPDFQAGGMSGHAPAAVTSIEAAFTRVWTVAGGAGAAPQVIHRIWERFNSPRTTGILVGDLPAETEAAVLATLAGLTLTAKAGRALFLCAEPELLRGQVLGLLDRLGIASPGPVVARLGALRDALARGELPALVCLGLGEMSTRAIQALSAGPAPWLATVDVVMLVRVDRLLPIEATHLAFTLRRLTLALSQQRATPLWVAVGEGTLGAQRLLEQSVARSFERLPLGAATTATARVFIRRSSLNAAELLQWGRTLVAENVAFHIEDAVGELGNSTATAIDSTERLHHHPGYHGGCSLALLDERQLTSLFRMRAHLAHQVVGGTQLSCWFVKDSPLARFLTQRGTLAGLQHQEELPSARPVVGLHNPYLAAAHLEAALHEGKPDEVGLRQSFGEAAVAELLATQQNIRIEGMRARWDERARTIVRSRILTRAATPWPDERRETVTRSIVEVRSENDGALLCQVDRRLAATRYYPYRVFQARGTLYQVGQPALLPTGNCIRVSPAAAGAMPTVPVLDIELIHQRWIGEAERHQFDQLLFARAVSVLTVSESVTGAMARGGKATSVSYPAVGVQYDSVAAVIAFERLPSTVALDHVGRLIDLILPAHLLAEPDDIEVIARPQGIGALGRPALVFVDRNLDGIGVAEALDARTVHDLLRWAWGVLNSCSCMDGCPACTPIEILQSGADKQGALKLLGG